jgi:elongator complex protein 5
LIIDTLTPLSSNQLTSPHLSTFLSTIISPGTSLLSVYHVDIPTSIETANNAHTNSYAPTPFTTLTYLATSILRIQNLSHVIARKKARDKSLQEPVFGLDEHREGVVTGLDSSKSEERRSVVVELDARRKSGRGVSVVFVLSPPPPPSKSAVASSTNSASTGRSATSGIGSVILLDDHPLYATAPVTTSGTEEDGKEEVETTFSMGLTEKQRRDRDNVVLPYFDAQKEGGALGAGEGGRILYDMGEEDHEDFDDEEDEI